ALFSLLSAIGRVLARYHLVIDGHSTVVAGAAYVDINFWLPAYDLIIAAWLLAGGALATAAFSRRFRSWLIDIPSHWVLPRGGMASVFIVAGVIPTIVERVYVEPNQITLERPYLLRSIEGTRRAYNLAVPALRNASSRSQPTRSRPPISIPTQPPCRTRASG